jgi:hypothetical protein
MANPPCAKRGDALALNRLFIQTPVPMVLIRNDRRLHGPDPAGQLYLRRRVGDLRRAPAGVANILPGLIARSANP